MFLVNTTIIVHFKMDNSLFLLKAMIIVAWNGDGNPTKIFDSDVFKKVLSVFITASILKLGQGMQVQI